MEYYDYKEVFNKTSTDSNDDMLVVAIASSMTGIFLFVIFCCCCSAVCAGYVDNCINNTLSGGDEEYGQRALRRMEEEKEKKKEDPEVRKTKLLNSFEKNKVSMVVTEHCFVAKPLHKSTSDEALTESTTTSSSLSDNNDEDSNHDQSDDDSDEQNNNSTVINVSAVINDIESGEPNELYLPVSSKDGKEEKRKVPNCCAICLCPYDVGDTIIWSSNGSCQHAFHDECIVPWLVKNQNGECPCCRTQFTDLPPPNGKNGENNGPSIWSIRSWFNRIRYTFVSQRE